MKRIRERGKEGFEDTEDEEEDLGKESNDQEEGEREDLEETDGDREEAGEQQTGEGRVNFAWFVFSIFPSDVFLGRAVI